MWAARNGHEDAVRRLVKGGADLNLKNGDNASATMVAIYNDRFDMAAMLVELGADVNDGSLYTAVEMRESTTDQFAFDGSRLAPESSEQTDRAGPHQAAAGARGGSAQTVHRPVPLHVDAEQRPIRQLAVLPGGRRVRCRSTEGLGRA